MGSEMCIRDRQKSEIIDIQLSTDDDDIKCEIRNMFTRMNVLLAISLSVQFLSR